MSKKILFIIDNLGCGGAEKVTIELADYMARQGNDVTLAVLNGKKDYFKTPANIHYIDLGFSDFFAFGKLWKNRYLSDKEQHVLQQLLNQKFDLIIPEYNNGHWLRPYLTGNVWHWVHGDLIEKRPAFNVLNHIKEYFRVIRYKAKFIKLLDGANIITVSQHLMDKYVPLLPHASIINIHNGVDQKKLMDSISEVDVQESWDVMFVGRVHKIKQVDHALHAFAQSGLTGRMAIIGDGPERGMVQQLISTLHLQDRVDFIGKVKNPASYLIKTKCLIMTSFDEGGFIPLTIAEALSLNIPVVTYEFSESVSCFFKNNLMEKALVPRQQIDFLAKQLKQVVFAPYAISAESISSLSIHTTYIKFMKLIEHYNL